MGAAAVVAALALPVSAGAVLRASDQSVLTGSSNSYVGGSASVGDVNGDGRGDLAVALVDRDEARRGRVFVVFGGAGAPPATLNDLGSRGYTVISDEEIGVRAAGDFDGDGKADLLVGSPSGQYVVYGKAGTASIDMQADTAQLTRVGAAGNNGARATAAAGDFNGDGADDLLASTNQNVTTIVNTNAVVFGGPRVGSLDAASGPRTLGFPARQTCKPAFPSWLYFWLQVCVRNPRPVTPIGDFNGDGNADLIVGSPSQLVFGRAGSGGTYDPYNPTPAGSGIPLSGPVAPVEGVPLLSDGDLDGDGKADLVRPSTQPLPSGAQVAIRGQAGLTSLNTATQPTIPYPGPPTIEGLPSASHTYSEPLGDFDGNGTPDRLVPWNGYDADVPTGSTTPSPYAGAILLASDRPDRVAPQLTPRQVTERSYSLVLPDSRNVGANSRIHVAVQEPVKIELSFRKVGGLIVGTVVRDVVRSAAVQGAEIPFDGTVNGTRLDAGDYLVDVTPIDAAGNRGETQDLPFTIKPGTTPGPTTPGPTTPAVAKTPVDPLSGAWKTVNRAAKQANGSVVLTPAVGNVGGQVYWPTPVDLRNSTVEFDLEISGGTGAGVGMTLAYTQKPPVLPVAPGTGSTLGFGGANQAGFAVAFVTARASSLDPGSNFVGVTHGIRPQARPTSMTYVQSADPGYSLRDRTIHVKSTVRGGNALTVEVDGKKLIDIPAGPYVSSWLGDTSSIYNTVYAGTHLQFTASTGPANFQQHLVKNVSVTYD